MHKTLFMKITVSYNVINLFLSFLPWSKALYDFWSNSWLSYRKINVLGDKKTIIISFHIRKSPQYLILFKDIY